jgi:hypothetical protein
LGSERSVIDAHRHVRQRPLQADREALGAREPIRLSGRRPRGHRTRRVEQDERLRIRALAHEPVANHDRLRRRDRDERRQDRESDRGRHRCMRPRSDDAEQAPELCRAPPARDERCDRECAGEHEEGVERRQEGDAEQTEHQ